ncbi:MAG TPA: hypothetical protein VKU19_22605 [Bryobacteraceae bacterium]|nr:hypothetical protein [Bryobacteraceae bacterium]
MRAALSVLIFVGVVHPVHGAEPKRSFETASTERATFPASGLIRLDHSYGYLVVEGWDEPVVEATVTKSTDWFGDSIRQEKADRRFDEVRVAVGHPSASELTISTALPVRNSLFSSVLPSGKVVVTSPLPPNNKRGVTVEYRVRVPRSSRLEVHQDNGYVWVSDLNGDIEVHSHTGDMIVMLQEAGGYSIDARTGVGNVTSDIAGQIRRYLLGSHLTYADEAPAHRVLLRMGRGSITIKQDSPAR